MIADADLGPTRPVWAVPEYETHELAPKRSRYCVCIFVVNEGRRLEAQLEKMRPWTGEIDVIIADGGSTDGSVALDRMRAGSVRTLLVKRGPGKLSAQMRMAFAYALTEGYDGIITMDGNDKDDPAGLGSFLRALDQGADHVQGSRFVRGGKAIDNPLSRVLAIRLIHAPLISVAAGFRYTDTTNGFRAYSRRFLEDPRVAPFRDVFVSYELHYYLAIRAARLGFRVCELPVLRRYPAQGPTPTKISPVRGNLVVLRTLVRACLRRFDP